MMTPITEPLNSKVVVPLRLPDRRPTVLAAKSLSLPSVKPALNGQTSMLLQSLTDGLVDGILIISEQGNLLYANRAARQFCQQVTPSDHHADAIPSAIWQLCESLMVGRDLCSSQCMILEEEIGDRPFPAIRVRVQWIELDDSDTPHFLVMLEDRLQSLQNLAIAERHKYGLTARETDVWLRQRSNQSYKEIANELHISVNTVKKHIKNARAKQDAFRWANAD